MLPTAGLFLPETLHRANFQTTAPAETDGTRLKYFQRKYGRPKQDRKNSDGRSSSTALDETGDEPQTESLAIPTVYSFADHVLHSSKASSDLLTFASIIRLVRTDTEEAKRLYLSSAVSNFLDSFPAKRIWIEGSLQELQRVLNDIGQEMDAAWGQEEDCGAVASKRKIDWGLKNQKKLLKKQQQLNACHGQLTGAIYVMQTAELCGKPGAIAQDPIFEAPARPWVPHDVTDAQRGPYSRQRYRTSHTNLSASNLNPSSETQWDNAETTSINSLPAELAGSTPDDPDITRRHHSQNLLSPQASREFITEGSSLLRRPRARSDYFRSTASRVKVTRASIDSIPFSSTLDEKTLERNDSTLSTQATVSMPMLARRYQATSVDIHRHPDRHRSLPSELPHLKSQPSLIDDLAGYVIPNTGNAQLSHREWTTSPSSSMPCVAVTSSPVIGHTLPAVAETASTPCKSLDVTPLFIAGERNNQHRQTENHRRNETTPLPQHHDSDVVIQPTNIHEDVASTIRSSVAAERSTSSLSYHSLSTDGPRSPSSLTSVTLFSDSETFRRPSSQRPSQRIAKKRSNMSSSRSFASAPSCAIATIVEPPPTTSNPEEMTNQDATPTLTPQTAPTTTMDDVSRPVLVHHTDIPQELEASTEGDDAVLSVLQQRFRCQLQVKTMAENLVRAASTMELTPPTITEPTRVPTTDPTHSPPVELAAQVPIPVSELAASIPRKPLADPNIPNPVETLTSPAPSINSEEGGEKKPMSAMAKRRAAHARRMQIAFGGVKAV